MGRHSPDGIWSDHSAACSNWVCAHLKMAKPRSTQPGDVVLVHFREQPASYARVEDIRLHERRGWFFCDLLFLGVPPQPVTWILQRHQIDGEAFTMGGEGVRIEPLPELGRLHGRNTPEPPPQDQGTPLPGRSRARAGGSAPRDGKVISLFPRQDAEEKSS